ncbi:penicillin-binding protein 1A [Methylotuvimicrobium sp. KM2]|uniref:penicillin-binding protein 1A n=1 Tax=Methylotuvimicrobium sp. KM2 TaxID=3133976 RepID=UPI0031017197
MIIKLLITFFKWLSVLFLIGLISAAIYGYLLLERLSEELPDINQLKDVHYQIPLQIYSKDKLLIAEFGEKKRSPITIDQAPKELIHAFLAAEDKHFYEHHGVDFVGLFRAALKLAATGKKEQGGSTITMQVTRNFLLSREKTYTRKLKEILLSLKIEETFSKDTILELYLNKIYLGQRSYGVAAAAQTYYGKSLNELTLAESAMIAGLPKAPSAYNPIVNPARAMERRDYVLYRMHKIGYIDQQTYQTALAEANTARVIHRGIELSAPFIAEMARQKVLELYGPQAYGSGMKVYTTITRPLQNAATRALRNALHSYDERHGYRFKLSNAPAQKTDINKLPIIGDSYPASIKRIDNDKAIVQLRGGKIVEVPWSNMKWARKFISRNARGNTPQSIHDLFKTGDAIFVRQLNDKTWALAQIPEAEGAFVAIDTIDGAILALAGGYDFNHNKFNRVTQSNRQPGSGFKPIIYTTALENGYTAASLINDAPIVLEGSRPGHEWRPENYNRRFSGPTSLRVALRQSKNLISVRLLLNLGIKPVIETAMRFGFEKNQLPNSYTLALGSGQATPLQMARAYAVFANGGFLIEPYLIDRIESGDGKLLYQANPQVACLDCTSESPAFINQAPRIITPQINFLMNSLLRDVVQRGTAVKAKRLGRTDLAGKTGTTNDHRDAWFNGYSTTVSATAWVGFDNFNSLGYKETGGAAALPMWMEFMQTALRDKPEIPLTPPEGVAKMYVDAESGMMVSAAIPGGIWEFFDTTQQAHMHSRTNFELTDPGEAHFSERHPIETLF